jgi:hypothetical protein
MEREFNKGELKHLDEMNKLIRSVFPYGYLITKGEGENKGIGSVFPVDTNDQVTDPMFDNSLFFFGENRFPNEFKDVVLFPDNVNDAIKDKVTTLVINEQNLDIICKGGKNNIEHNIGKKIDDETIVAKLIAAKSLKNNLNLDKYPLQYERPATAEEMAKLVAYQPVTFRYNDSDIALVATCKLFPSIKKNKAIYLKWRVNKDREDYLIIVNSTYLDLAKPVIFYSRFRGVRC